MVVVIAVAEMFGISGRRDELVALLERFERWAAGEPGRRRYTFAAALADPSRFGARPSELTVYSGEGASGR